MTRPELLDSEAVAAWISGHPAWRADGSHLLRELETVDYPSGVRLIEAQVSLAERLDHHPVVTLGYRRVCFELWTHDRGGVTQLDLDYAQGLDAIIADEFAELIL